MSDDLVKECLAARDEARPHRPPSETRRLSLSEAYAVQDRLRATLVERGERVARAREDAVGDTAFVDVAEEFRIAAQAAHHPAGEEHAEQQAPAPGVPALFVEFPPFLM